MTSVLFSHPPTPGEAMECRMFICLAILPSDPLGQTVENAIVMLKNKSRIAPSVTSCTHSTSRSGFHGYCGEED